MKTRILELLSIKPRTFKQLRTELELSSYKESNKLNIQLKEMQKNSKIFFKKNSESYHKKDKLELIGTFFETKNDYGFVEVEGYEKQKSFFVPGRFTLNAVHGDSVRIIALPAKDDDRDDIGKIVRVMQRNGNNLVGLAREEEGKIFMDVVDNASKFPYEVSNSSNINIGDVLIAKFLDFQDHVIKVKVIDNMGPMIANTDWEVVAKRHNLETKFPQPVTDSAFELTKKVMPTKRKDLTERLIVTIDGIYSKDLDDAIDVKKLSNGNFRLGVHIADVSHYVEKGSLIDEEAYERGTSVYLINTVLPMLPETLSNDLCSLNPNTKKLAMSVDMEIDNKGQVIKTEIFESIIESKHRLTYNEVADLLEGRKDLIENKELTNMLFIAKEISDKIRKVKIKSGMIDFVLPEVTIKLDDQGEPTMLSSSFQTVSEKLIEDLMVVTNESVAKELDKANVPALFRIHPRPKVESLDKFKEIIRFFGYQIETPSEEITNKHMMELVNKLDNTHISLIIKRMLIQTMEKAVYSPYDEGHYGQGLANYAHFTSPIRRYPDLLVHRAVKKYIIGSGDDANDDARIDYLTHAAKQTSDRERLAMAAERKLMDIKKVRLMKDQLGQNSDATMVTITNFGIFLELENFTQGLARFDKIKGLTDSIVDNGKSVTLAFENGKNYKFKLGQTLNINISDMDVARGLMDFEINESNFKK